MAELQKTVSFGTILALSITAMMGTGIFLGVALAAKFSGNASILAWIFLSIITVYVASLFGELTGMYPKAGGVYEFAKQAYGRFPSFIIGWITWIVGNVTTTLMIVAALDFLLPGSYLSTEKMLVAFALVLILNYITYRGIEASSAVLIVFATISIVVILSIIIPGAFHFNTANFVPFFTNPAVMIFVSLFFILETFFGWESATFLAEETPDAEHVIPKVLIISSVIVSFLGICMAFVTLGMVAWPDLINAASPLSLMTSQLYTPLGAQLIAVGIFLTLVGSAAGGIVSTPRLLLALARDKLFIEQLSHIHPVHNTPYKAIAFQTVVSLLVILLGAANYITILSMLVPLALFMYISVLLCVPILRRIKPQHPRPFKAPFGHIGPVFVSLVYAAIVGSWLYFDPAAFTLFKIIVSLILFGIPIYWLLLLYYDPETIIKMNSSFAYLNLLLENFLLPKYIRREMLGIFQNLKDKVVLEFGSGVGTFTLHLAESVGDKGKIYATELSKKNVDILTKRLSRRGLTHVEIIHDEHQVNRVHPAIKTVDIIFSVGMMSYLQDVKKVLREMRNILPKNGKICLVEYVDFFWILPNVGWLSSNEKIAQLFKDAGFSVQVKRRSGLFWNYLFVYGIKSDDPNMPYI